MTIRPFLLVALVGALGLGGCGTADKLKNVGKEPALSPIENPQAMPGYRPVQMPMPQPIPVHYNSNSLWRSGNRNFFKDQRAQNVGDILTVKVAITDKAEFDNATERTRSAGEDFGAGGVVGSVLSKVFLPKGVDSSAAVNMTTESSHKGEGSVNRSEELETNVAAVVTQLLPNGNMVIEGRQEVRVNFEVRELVVAGVVRPEDIASDNTIESSKIAEARIAYGGRGQITDVQQPRYGQQVYDIVMPF
ncbi:flagellar basal body L-ring protein FlgH [Rhodobium gokarnense]|uniref:Flagellar L-ring protein n=1 Tax=Rhodobium gokarnense TaxID=364296 RepID=A0ABT3HD70_9HYPH|nr:flagellar basal body L-ring protein FlgH [Rhodobium gokarnense]MCW2308323.1 flagellar L-ring protein precursor FlgH [Rhodobium gokarnense]